MKVRQTAPPPAPKPTYTRYDRAEKTFHYTQDGFTRDVSLHDANTRGILAFAGTSAVTVPLSIAFGSATGLGVANLVAASLAAGGVVGAAVKLVTDHQNGLALAEATEHGYCNTYEQFNEKPINRDFDQTAFQHELVDHLDPNLVSIHYCEDITKLDGKVPTLGELQKEFKKLAARPDIPFQYIVDGCYSRAHLMCEEMSQDGLNNAKMFVSVKNEGKPDELLTAGNDLMNVSWNYHVAPLVLAEDEATHKVSPYIMDPSMADHPLPPEEWIGKMWDKKDEIYVDVTRREHYEPEPETNNFADWLGHSHQTLHDYAEKLEDIKKNGYHPENDA